MDLKKGMLGKFASKKQANIKKGKAKKKDRRHQKVNVLQKGLKDKSQRKMMDFWKERQKESKEEKQNKKKIMMLKTNLFGE